MSAVVRFALLLTLSAIPFLALAQQGQQDPPHAAQETATGAGDTTAPADPAPTGEAPPAQDPASPVPAADAAQPEDGATAPDGPAPTDADVNAATAGAGAGNIGAPQDGKGQVVFFRPSKFAGSAVGFKVREGDTELGKLRSGRYFVASVDPGTHEYTVHSESKDVLTLEVESGETYYVQGTLTMGVMVGRPNLSPSDEATFNGMADKLKPAQ